LPFFLASLQLTEISSAYAAMLGAALLGKFLFGFLADRQDPRRVFLLNLAVMAVGAVLLALTDAPWVLPALAVFGLGWGGLYTMLQLLTVQSFGLRALGRILGLMAVFDCVGGGIGGVVIARIAAGAGGYPAAFGLLAGLIALAGLASSQIRQEFRAT
jgi:MFS family permease